jgi:formylglycine-generating enzyme required for sulfatase activity
MVYVPQGSFYAGDGTVANIEGHFEDRILGNPKLITSEAALTLGGGGVGSLGNHNASGQAIADDFNDISFKTLPAAFPKGFAGFYCMKYEVSQEQYVDFLNTLTRRQQRNRVGGEILATTISDRWVMNGAPLQYSRNGISCARMVPDTISAITFVCDLDSTNAYNLTNDGQNIPCNYVNPNDLMAYADWSGLRPMTELEFEKICRGVHPAFPDEYAWGTTNVTPATSLVNPGQTNEVVLPSTANANYFDNLMPGDGPVRCGVFAKSTSTRETAGASACGAMEMSGNLWELVVGVGSTSFRSFTSSNGNGRLTLDGWADASGWPTAIGLGRRGSSDGWALRYARVSSRYQATSTNQVRDFSHGIRCVRTAP